MRVLLPVFAFSAALTGGVFASGDCPTYTPQPNFGNTPSASSGAGSGSYVAQPMAPSGMSGSGATYVSQPPIAAGRSTPSNPTAYASAPPSAEQAHSQAAAPTHVDLTLRANTEAPQAPQAPKTPTATSPAQASSKTPVSTPVATPIAPPSKYNVTCDCYEFESDIPAVSNTNQIAAEQLLTHATAAGAIPWTATVEYAHEAAQSRMEPYAIYFCSEAVARTAGDGPAAKAEYKKTHDGRAPADTIFDNSGVMRAFDAAGIGIFVKVPLSAENAALADKWNAHENTLIIAAPASPNDEKLKVFNREECNETNVAEYLMGFKEKYKMWKWKAQMAAVNEHNAQK